MSPSEEGAKFCAAVAALRGQIDRAIEAGEVAALPREAVENLVSSAVKLYAAAVEDAEQEIPSIDATVSTTEAMVLACAMLRAQHMNPFDLALWFSRTSPSLREDASGT